MYVFGSGSGGGELVRGLGLGFINSGGESGVCVLVAMVWVGLGERGWAAWVGGGGVMSVCVVSLDSLC